ncbi:MAG: HpcH/HpaI aldolase/citrate lyase family protein [Allosphingosinicella sp.]|uniref:HpcH/HpaI aldolase/citrate lyase family protein n=1 Tax=Allosphingosinicella sp. TaxID=2823234 RepID=UPI003956BBE4
MNRSAELSSILFVPGSRPDRFGKALASGADLVCIDLEDAVADGDKDAAREAALDAIAAGDARLALRINGLATAHGLRDLLALREAERRPAFLFLPMVDDASHPRIARSVLGTDAPPLVPLIETAAALRRAEEIADEPGVSALMFGGGDLAAELGVELAWEPLAAARGRFVLAAAGRGLALIDVPFVHIGDTAGLEREARQARRLGFTAKAAIHPEQVAPIRRAFAPSEEEVAEARDAIAAWRAAGGGAARHKGRMLEAPLMRRYEATLAKVEKNQDA